MRPTFHRTLSTLVVAGALVLSGGGIGAAALNAKPLRAEFVPSGQVQAKPLRAETAPAPGLVLAKPLRAELVADRPG